MSDLLNSASLVLIPSGYKEDTVYSVVPSDGSGDMAFTRASNGTRINSAGLVEVVAWNLLQSSETFNDSYWNKVNGTITSDSIVAPNGTTTADLFTITNNSAFVEKTIAGTGTLFTFIPNTQYTFSCYFKKGSIDYNFKMLMYDGVSVTNSGTINLTTPSSSTVNYEDVGNGWYRFYHTFTSSASATTGYFYAVNYDYSTTITSGTNVYLWGAQVVQGSAAKPYFPTTDRLNVPRLTYQNGGGGCPSLLLEKQSTNLVLYSEQFDNAAWIKLNGSVTANTSISPDGTQNADSFIPNTTSGIHALRSSLFNQSSTASHSWFIKANGYTKVAVRESELVGNYATFNLTTGTLISTNQTGSIQNLGNGWYRCTLVDTTTGANAQTSILVLPDSYTSGDPIIVNWSGDGIKGVYAWGAQVEIINYATSYIPTTSSSATRVADACFKTGISSLFGSEFTLFADVNLLPDDGPTRILIAKGSGGTYDNFISIEKYNSGTMFFFVVTDSSSTSQVAIAGGTAVHNQRYKFAARCKNGSYAFYINGVQIGTSSVAYTPSASRLDLHYFDYYGQNEYNQVCLFPVGLTNAELASLTTI